MKYKPAFVEYLKKASPNGVFEMQQVFMDKISGQRIQIKIKHKTLFYVLNALVYFLVFFGTAFSAFQIGKIYENQWLYLIGVILGAILSIVCIAVIKFLCIKFEAIEDKSMVDK